MEHARRLCLLDREPFFPAGILKRECRKGSTTSEEKVEVLAILGPVAIAVKIANGSKDGVQLSMPVFQVVG